MNLKYTLGFIRAGDHVLMLNRFKAPNMGLWNGIGGRIERGETPAQCIVREALEETGFGIVSLRFAGVVTWDQAQETGASGMYVFVADVDPKAIDTAAAVRQDEGILAWLPVEWVMDVRNFGVVSNIPYFLPSMLNDCTPLRWHCTYRGPNLRGVVPIELPDNFSSQVATA